MNRRKKHRTGSHPLRMARWAVLPAAAMGTTMALSPASAEANPVLNYTILTMGLTDALHVGLDGKFRSTAILANAVGQVLGYSERNYDDSWSVGSSWIHDLGQTIRIGLYDPEHTRIDGVQASFPGFLNNRGQAGGYSVRFDGGGAINGYSSWVYNAGITTRVGLTDAEHTGPSGEQYSDMWYFNARGDAAGNSSRTDYNFPGGQSVWLYTKGVTRRIGYYDAEHTSVYNEQNSFINGLNDSGQAVGSSARFLGTEPGGETAWLASASGHIQLGLTGSEYLRADGVRLSNPVAINNAGQVIGSTNAFSGMDNLGPDAWFYDNGSTTRIGLYDPDHTRADGYHESSAYFLSPSGIVAGQSARFAAPEEDGSSAWVHSGGVTTKIGFYDSEHTLASGAQTSWVSSITDDGTVIGYSVRYAGTSFRGYSAWLHRAGAAQRAGLLDAEHTDTDGAKSSTIDAVNSAGQAIGLSSRYVGTDYHGASAWFYEGGVTTRIGLIDGVHTRDDGFRSSANVRLNEAGQVIGTSTRYAPYEIGQSGWFYDSATATTTPLVFSVDIDGLARTRPEFLTEDGAVLGTYDNFGGESRAGTFAFYWSLNDGFHELSDLADGGISGAGWDWLNEVRGIVTGPTGLRYVIGQGFRIDGSAMAFLLAINGGGGWTNPGGGSWTSGSNWSLADAPSFKDDAVFNLGSTYTVTLSQDATAHDLNVSAGNVTMGLGGKRMLVGNLLQVTGGARLKLENGVLRTAGMNVSGGGQLDLTDIPMVVDYTGASPLSVLTSMIAVGRNGGAWDGDGITSSLANAAWSLGIADNAELGLLVFDGEPVGPSSLLVRLTFNGDANLDGKVDVLDLVQLANSWLAAGSWFNGDFDYSGFVDAHDLGLMALNWQASASFAAAAAGSGLPASAVPEAGMILPMGAVALLCRRRQSA